MEDRLRDLLEPTDFDISEWDDEFYVGIGKARELSGLSESQIRYLERLRGVNIGRKKDRNREYTKRDILLLRWAYASKDLGPSRVADLLREHQDEILTGLGRTTIYQVVGRERSVIGQRRVVSGLVALLLSIWQEAAQCQEGCRPSIEGIILGPQDEQWKTQFLEDLANGRAADLAKCLVVWRGDAAHDLFADPQILFSHQAWYLPFSDKLGLDTSHFSRADEPFAIVLVTLVEAGVRSREVPSQTAFRYPTAAKERLARMAMESLQTVMTRHPPVVDRSIALYSSENMSRGALAAGLSLLLEACVAPYFPDCYCYIVNGELVVLAECGKQDSGYLPKVATTGPVPRWLDFAIRTASPALAQDIRRSPHNVGGAVIIPGSVVCVPLIGFDEVLGVLAVENFGVDQRMHCLMDRDGITGTDLLRYLLCIAEIAADWGTDVKSSSLRADRWSLVYSREGTTEWYRDIYSSGGLDYTPAVNTILNWIREGDNRAKEPIEVVLVDIHNEEDVAREHHGFEVILEVLRKTRERISSLIQDDPVANRMAAAGRFLCLEYPVADHLLLVAASPPRGHFLAFLERIREFWRKEQGDAFWWDGKEVGIQLRIGVCRFTELHQYERDVAAQIMKLHIDQLARHLLRPDAPDRLHEHNAIIPIEPV